MRALIVLSLVLADYVYRGYGGFVTSTASFSSQSEPVAARVSISLLWFSLSRQAPPWNCLVCCTNKHSVRRKIFKARHWAAWLRLWRWRHNDNTNNNTHGLVLPHLFRGEMGPNDFQNCIERRKSTPAGGVHKHRFSPVVAVQQSITALSYTPNERCSSQDAEISVLFQYPVGLRSARKFPETVETMNDGWRRCW